MRVGSVQGGGSPDITYCPKICNVDLTVALAHHNALGLQCTVHDVARLQELAAFDDGQGHAVQGGIREVSRT